ncbi:42 kDa endochitinase-like protein [Ophiobolus disseminans]|uniref:chitinase n=1 Tax=Ophiobolus disseminans TaxID=1469910 RepID=A0A6A6ZTU0_9PLEO|nr:42 kDa endochitinase-like protein [Ophiobolus disseminans]
MSALSTTTQASKLRYIMYLTGQHNVVPELALVSDITHVALAFMQSEVFNDANRTEWPLFTTVQEVRPKFAIGTVIQVAIGGWGNTVGFETAAKTAESRKLFAKNIRSMLDATGADGVDIDWEYPGGNGEEYKTNPNSGKTWEITAYPLLLAEIRDSIGPSKIISAAVPGLPRDMLAFTNATIPRILDSVDFFNIMTYDLMNRRDTVTKHHTGITISLEGINAYLERGVPPEKANVGLAYYVKYFKIAPGDDCRISPIGCRTGLMEDPETGADLGKTGGFSWHDQVPEEVSASFQLALNYGIYDEEGGGHYYWDDNERIFWTWDTPSALRKKLPVILQGTKLGGAFAWGLGEDAPKFAHLQATTEALRTLPVSGSNDAHGERNEL